MKKFIGLLLCSLAISNVAHSANLNIKIAGAGKDNTYFLCLEHTGCVSMLAANHGKVFPLDAGQVNRIFMVNSGNLRVYMQPLPKSCNVNVDANQTLTVKGKIVKGANDNTHIGNLECSVA